MFTGRYSKSLTTSEILRYTIPVIAGILALVLLVLLAYLAVWCWNRRKQRERLDFIEFTDRPRILILYSDDCIQHRQAVIALADYLYHAANCEVYIDELELRRQPTVLPSDWLIRRANDAEYYLMLFTEGSAIYFKQPRRHFLLSDRPWDELFGLGMKLVLGRLLRDTRQSTAPVSILAQQRRYICIQLPYSPPTAIPDFLLTLQCPCFNLPDDLLALVCFLHHLDPAAVAPSVPLHAEHVIDALNAAATFIGQNRDYLSSRLAPIEVDSGELRDLSTITANLRLLSSFDTDVGTESEQRRLIAVELNSYRNHGDFPLIANDEDDLEDPSQAFPLLPLDEND